MTLQQSTPAFEGLAQLPKRIGTYDHEAFDTMIADISSKIVDQSVGCDELCSRIKRFVAVYNDHANGEENIFFPIADKYLQDSHWTRIKKAWK